MVNFISSRLWKSRMCDPQLFKNCTRKQESVPLVLVALQRIWFFVGDFWERRITFNTT